MNLTYTLVKTKRRKRTTSIVINEHREVIVKAPFHVSNYEIDKFVIHNKDWILKNLKKFKPIKKLSYVEGEKMLFLGAEYTLKFVQSPIKIPTVQNTQKYLVIKSNKQLKRSEVKFLIQEWYKQQSLLYITKKVNYYTNKMGLNYGRITIKNVKSIWGSCSSKKNLNFNIKLIMAPRKVVDYVILHEVCHLIHLNHSYKFWNLVKDNCPKYKEYKEWLHKNSHLLIL